MREWGPPKSWRCEPLSLLTFFAAAKKVSAAPHRGSANKPITKQGKAKAVGEQPKTATPTDQQENKERPTPQANSKRPKPTNQKQNKKTQHPKTNTQAPPGKKEPLRQKLSADQTKTTTQH
jgi:hypothetical protein